LGKTLSEFGYVSRGICEFDSHNNIAGFKERTKIYSQDGNIVFEENQQKFSLAENTLVSMNFWGFTPDVFDYIEQQFKLFLSQLEPDSKAEFFIALFVESLIQKHKATFKVIPTESEWFGVTYVEDKPWVQQQINQLIDRQVYPKSLWE